MPRLPRPISNFVSSWGISRLADRSPFEGVMKVALSKLLPTDKMTKGKSI